MYAVVRWLEYLHFSSTSKKESIEFPISLKTFMDQNMKGGGLKMVDSSINSPRRMLSLSRERAFVSILDDEREGRFALSNKQGAKLSEVYGFVGSISTIVATGVFFLWAYLPEPWLHYLGITYYPSRYWALAIPTYAMVTLLFIVLFYIGLNYMATVPSTSWNSIFDNHTRDASRILSARALTDGEHPIDPISDIPITEVNASLFG